VTVCKFNLCTLENTSSTGTTAIHISVFAPEDRQLSAVRNVTESGNAEESKGGGVVCQSARCVGVLLRVLHIHSAIFGNSLSHFFHYTFTVIVKYITDLIV